MKMCFRYASHYIKLGAERDSCFHSPGRSRKQPEYGNWASHKPCLGAHPRLRGDQHHEPRAFRLPLPEGLETGRGVQIALKPCLLGRLPAWAPSRRVEVKFMYDPEPLSTT